MIDWKLALVAIILITFTVALHRFKFNLKKATSYFWNMPAGRQAIAGIGTFVGVGVIIIVLTSPSAWGDQVALRNGFFPDATISLGVMTPIGNVASPFCQNEGVDNRLTSEGRFDLTMYRNHRFELGAFYNHNSCALNLDQNVLDSYGLTANWRIDLWRLFR